MKSLPIAVLLGSAISHPIQDVIDMIQKLRETAKIDQENDDKVFEQLTHDFGNEKERLEKDIKSEADKREANREEAEAQESRVISLAADIKELEKKMGWNKDSETKLTNKHDKEQESYSNQISTLNDIIAAVKECIAELQKGTGLLEKKEKIQAMAVAFLKPKEAASVSSLLQKENAPDDPKARVYDTKTRGVTELFEKLLRSSKDKLNEVELLSQKTGNEFSLAQAAMNGEHKEMSRLADEKRDQKGKAQGAHDAARQAQADANDAFNQFTTNLRDATQIYKDGSDRHAVVSKEREDEVEAMGFAEDVLKQVSGVRAEHTPLFLQEGANPNQQIAMLLHKVGLKYKSSKMEELSMRITAVHGKGEGPFNQINNMITKLIDQLVLEQRKEDDHKDWCDKELEVTRATDKDKKEKLEAIETAQNKAEVAKEQNLEGKVSAETEIADLQNTREEEKAERKREKDNNKISIQDAKKAQKGIQQALRILNEWFAKRDTSTTKTEGNDKVVQLLEDAETHYSQMQANVESAEQQGQLDHATSLANIKRTIATLDAQIVGHEDSLDRLGQRLQNLAGKHKHTSDALFEVKQYLDDLAPACIGEEGSYEKRRDARSAEREALKEAKGILKKAFDELEKEGKSFAEINVHRFLA